MQIFEKLSRDNQYKLTKTAKSVLMSGFARILSVKSENFSNGRLVRKVFDRVRIKQAMRASDNTITHADIDRTFAERDIAAFFDGERTAIGFQRSA